MINFLLALLFVCPAVTLANVNCTDGSFCPDGNTCCSMTEGGYGCCPMPSAVCCTDDKCCPEGSICLVSMGMCIHAASNRAGFYVSPSLTKTKSMRYPSLKDKPCPGGFSCPNNQTCCDTGCCPFPNAVCCTDGEHCCPSGYRCDLITQLCTQSNGNSIPMYTKKKANRNSSVGSRTMQIASPVTEKIVYCPGGLYYCPDYNTCCPSLSGQWNCCPFPSASCCADRIHCCAAGYRCDATGQHCLSGFFSQTARNKTVAQPTSILNSIFSSDNEE